MIRRLTIVSFVLMALAAPPKGPTWAAPAGSSDVDVRSRPTLSALKTAINTEVASARRIAPRLGIHIVEVDSGRDIYSFEADTRRILASNTKLFTSAAALDLLGPGYLFETPLYLRGEVRDGTLHGDLGVVGGGDPNLSGRDYNGDSFGAFRPWAAELRARGIRRVTGDVVLATGLFDREILHPDWPRDQLDRWYEAPVAALSFNDNCVLAKVEPRGAQAVVSLVPDLPIFRLDARVGVSHDRRRESVRFERPTQGTDWQQLHTYEVRGTVHRATESVDRWITVADPAAYFGTALRHALLEEGIVTEGRILERDELPRSGTPWQHVATHRSSLLGALEILNKRSQNFYGESILKLLGARVCGDGSFESGVRAVEEFAQTLGLDPARFDLADGSGMSRGNIATPAQVTLLLRQMAFHRWGKEYLRTLPYSGEPDLRWETRLANGPYRGNVLAKTGALNGVSTLSGYAKGVSGGLYAFSFLMNDSSSNWSAKKAQDAILRALIDNG